jgi:hypothetical protein
MLSAMNMRGNGMYDRLGGIVHISVIIDVMERCIENSPQSQI